MHIIRVQAAREFGGNITVIKPLAEVGGLVTVEVVNSFDAVVIVSTELIPQVDSVRVYVDGELVTCDEDSIYGYSYGSCPVEPPVPTGIEPYGADPYFFPSGSTLPPLEDGLHRITLEVVATTGNVFVEESTFLVDTVSPEVTISSPVNDVVNYVVDPILEYEVTDVTSGVGVVEIFIDGINHGNIVSGTPLINLKNGLHILELRAQDLAKDDTGKGNETVVTIQFLTATDFSINTSGIGTPGVISPTTGQTIAFGPHAYIGSDGFGEHQADGILEELRILDFASTDAEIFHDYRLLLNNQRFQNNLDGVVIDVDDQIELERQGIDISRLNLPNDTLVLYHFDNSIQSEFCVGEKEYTSSVIISRRASNNDVDVLVRVPKGETVDRELIVTSLNKIVSLHTQLFITFEEVE